MANFFTLYGKKPERSPVVFTQDSLTDPSFEFECDIHNIVDSFGRSGMLASPGMRDLETLQYGDSTLLPDFQTAQQMVIDVTNEFNSLPSAVRAEFDNNPENLLAALGSSDDATHKRLIELGLAPKPKLDFVPPSEPPKTAE